MSLWEHLYFIYTETLLRYCEKELAVFSAIIYNANRIYIDFTKVQKIGAAPKYDRIWGSAV